jgi:hypothetical protein
MDELLTPLVIFLLLAAASLGALFFHERMPVGQRQEDTHGVVRLAANIFVVMTSLVLGLLINSAKNTYEAIDRGIHSFATELILEDENLRQLGPDGAVAREKLAQYVQQAVKGTWPTRGAPLVDDTKAEALLEEVGTSLRAVEPQGAENAEAWHDAEQGYQSVVRRRWSLVEDSEGEIPRPLLFVLVAWLVLIFASFGYRAPRNALVIVTFVVSALLIAGALYLVLDMELPFSGPIQVSPAPLVRALEHLQRPEHP